jgi:phage repressor protein C with HTH and peptisase S24 domain
MRLLSEQIRDRLRRHLKDSDTSLARFEAIHGINDGALKGFMSPTRKQVPSVDRAKEICAALGVELSITDPNDPPEAEVEFVKIGISVAVASAGPGIVNGEEHDVGHVGFERSWLAKQGINPRRASLLRSRGGSMLPTIPDDAVVLVDHQQTDVDRRGFIYAFVHQDQLKIKRLYGEPGQSLLVFSDNHLFPPESYAGEELNDFRVIGRVMWAGHRLGSANSLGRPEKPAK